MFRRRRFGVVNDVVRHGKKNVFVKAFFYLHRSSRSTSDSRLSQKEARTAAVFHSRNNSQADEDDGYNSKGHNAPKGALAKRSRGRRAAAALLLVAGAAAAGWAVTTGIFRVPVGDMISRSAVKAEVARQVRGIFWLREN